MSTQTTPETRNPEREEVAPSEVASPAPTPQPEAAHHRVSGFGLDVAACSLMLVLAFAFMSPGLVPGRVAAPSDQLMAFAPWQANYPDVHPLLPGGDVVQNQLPWHQWAANELQAGRFPLWVSGPLGGYNLFASYQPGVLFPLHLLWDLLPADVGYGIIMALKLWLAGMGMWFFLRALDLRAFACLLAALGFMFSGSLIAWLPWIISSVYILLPWLAWAVYGWSVQINRGALVWLAALIACAIFGGHPETTFFVLISAAFWAFCLLVSSPRQDWTRQAVGFALAAVIGVAIGAIQILAFLEALGLSHETAVRGTGMAAFHLDVESLSYWALPRTWGQLADGVLGGKDNITGAIGYVGLVAPLGLVFSVVAAIRRQLALRSVIPWIVLALFAWLVVYDVKIGGAIRSLPVFNQSVNMRWIMVVAFCVLVIGAFGWDWFAQKIEARIASPAIRTLGRRGTVGACLLALGILVLAAHLSGFISYPNMGKQPGGLVPPTDSYRLYWAIWAAGIALGSAGATLVWSSRWQGRRAMPLVLCGLLVADLWMMLITYNPTAPADHYYPTTSFIRQLSIVPPVERILVEGEGLPADTGLVYGFRDWRGLDPMLSQRAYKAATFIDPAYTSSLWTDYNMFMSDPNFYVANAFGIRYFILPRGYNPNDPSEKEPGSPDFTRLAYKDGLGLWEAQGVPGFAYLSDNVQAVPGESAAASWMKDLTWDKMRDYAAMVEGPQSMLAGMKHTPGGGPAGSVSVTQYTPGHIVLDVDAARRSLLVVAESYYPGWRVSVDDHTAAVLRANYISQGLVIIPGRHTVELRYEPGSFRYGALISLVGLASLLALGGWALLGRKRRRAGTIYAEQ